jgi:hypothetical protein
MATYSTSPLYNYLNVEIIINDTTGKYYFPDIPQLRDAKIQAISYYPEGVLATRDYNNVPLMSTAIDLTNTFVTFYSGNKEAIQNLPLYKLLNLGYIGNIDGLFTIDNLMIDFSKSYVSWANNYAPVTPLPFAIMFGVFYIK